MSVMCDVIYHSYDLLKKSAATKLTKDPYVVSDQTIMQQQWPHAFMWDTAGVVSYTTPDNRNIATQACRGKETKNSLDAKKV